MNKLLLTGSTALLALGACAGPIPGETASPAPRQSVIGATSITNLGAAATHISRERLAAAQVARPVAEFVGRYSRATGRLVFEPKQEEGPSGGRPLGGYVALNSNTVSLEDNGTTIEGPGTFNGGTSCGGTQICAVVTVTNDSARLIEDLRVEVLDLTGATVANGDSLPTGYPSTAGNNGGWTYNAVNPSGTASAPWIFGGYTGDFNFTVKVWGTYRRTSYSGPSGVVTGPISDMANVVAANATWSDSAPAWRDACLTTGAQLFSNQSGYTSAGTTIPFPFTVYDTTVTPDTWGGAIDVSSAGVVSLLGVGLQGANEALSGTSVDDYAYYGFWDGLTSNTAPGEVCAALDSTSSAPNRRFVVTWKNVTVPGVAASRLTFSIVFQEGTDKVFYLYHRWSNNATSCAGSGAMRGTGATVGVRGNGTGEVTQVSNNATLLPLHSATCPGSGAFITLSANPQ
ncbi:MAG: hypothetical protein JNK05_06850 [Myxococcales bacterium]|nr:hypothetical protein [Myxococcales bacterium]